MKVKTSELIGPALDWAVAKCEGRGLEIIEGEYRFFWEGEGNHTYQYSTRWSAGGPIIERERIAVRAYDHAVQEWSAEPSISTVQLRVSAFRTGPTPLIAAMRCYVASKLGDEVDIPDAVL